MNSIDKDVSFFHQRYDLNYENNGNPGTLVHQTAILRNRNDDFFIALDLDFYSSKVHSYVNVEQIRNWLIGAHENIEIAFIDSLSPDYFKSIK